MKSRILKIVLLLIIIFSFKGMALASDHYASTCHLTPETGDYLIDFSGQLLLSDSLPYKFEKSVNIPAGKYEIWLEAYDGYDTRDNSDPVKQQEERYYVQFKNGSSTVATTNSTEDLQDNVKEANWSGKVNDELEISQDVNKLVVQHAVPYKDQYPNSVEPVCMLLKSTVVPVAGQCGSAHQKFFTNKPDSNLCSQGVATVVSGSGPWTWKCLGQDGGEDAICVGNKEIPAGEAVDGGWTDYSYGPYGDCVNGVKTRTGTRTCTNPAPANGGKFCSGPAVNVERKACGSGPVDGGWTAYQYGPWTSNCIDGQQKRIGTRTCTNPAPANGGKRCQGLETILDSRPCSTFDKLRGEHCPSDLILTQNLRAPNPGEGYIRNGKYDRYTKGIVREAHILQKHLNRLGFNAGKVDGVIGPNTRSAIKRMQRFLRTAQDGYVGPITRELLNNSCNKQPEKKVVEKPQDVKCTRYLTANIVKGSQETEEIKKLQIFLNQYESENLEVNGIYDQPTINAVNRYQVKYFRDILYPWRLKKPNSIVMSTVRGHINRRYRIANKCLGVCQGAFSKYLSDGSRGSEVKKVQSFLKDLGFYKGPISGYYGKNTREAVRQFQNENYIDVLKPWGIPCQCGTGHWYQTTMNFANRLIGCAKPLPKLKHGDPLQCVIDKFPGKYKKKR